MSVSRGAVQRVFAVAAAIVVALLSVIVPGRVAAAPPHRSHPSPSSLARAAYNRLTPAQRVGQLFMTGVSVTGATGSEIKRMKASYDGSLFLRGRSTAGARAVHSLVSRVRPDATWAGVLPFVATDQEGGDVQSLQGKGFTRMPNALEQGRLTTANLRTAATTWGRQLAAAGVSVNLAPVADTVPKSVGTENQPIGRYHREFGHAPGPVGRDVATFVDGMRAGGVQATVKHFPGLGRATDNTDTSRHVTDPTGPTSSYLSPYRSGIKAGAQFVMVSSATYPKIDPKHRACFSAEVVGKLLRSHAGFAGLVMSDSFNAVAVADLPAGERAVRFFEAGGQVLLDSISDDLAAMTHAVLHQAAHSPVFAALMKRDVLAVLTMKAQDGLVAG